MLLVSLYGIATDYFYFADASFFLVSLLADTALNDVWLQFPKRAAAFLLTQGPTYLAVQMGASASFARYAYASCFLLLPWAGLATICWVSDRPAMKFVAVLALGVVTFATFGFPTETSVTMTLLVGLTALLSAAPPDRQNQAIRRSLIVVLTPLLIFSHDAALLAIPALVYLVFKPEKKWQLDGQTRRWFVAALSLSVAGWMALDLMTSPSNPLIAKALQNNARSIMTFKGTVHRPVAALAMLAILASVLFRVAGRRTRALRGVMALTVVLLLVALVRLWRADEVADRYLARSVLVWLMPFVPLLPDFFSRVGRREMVFVSLILMALTLAHVRSIFYWRAYKADFQAQLLGKQVDRAGLNERARQRLARYRWDWALPYAAALMTQKVERQTLLIDEKTWYSPLSCASFNQPHHFDMLYSQAEIEALQQSVLQRMKC
ncbi:MAG TPA: hypothetical protein VFW93_11365 [Aquabacterium sp.]|uniref:hypothetical protein n=1 Tax=Aquabacterium sp. TaxID=1872578 RepID=UPI002E2FCA00|nr:hypothetical protein [Aquabacterium sp.]HEX5356809.1 hypothetical protein [Aquabacterium sp.]